MDKEGARQWIYLDIPEHELNFSGWVPKLGKSGSKKIKIIQNAYIMESINGGRSDHTKYSSYKKYFSLEKKKQVWDFWTGGLLGRISSGGGDPDRIDVTVDFGDFKLEDRAFEAPEEWYSELHEKNNKFKFVDGFYETSAKAIEKFSKKSEDDIFGTRFFPVIVFPRKTKADVREIAAAPKSCSKPIVTENYIIFGTRCKSYEYTSVIEETYKAGGFVPIGSQWDWD